MKTFRYSGRIATFFAVMVTFAALASAQTRGNPNLYPNEADFTTGEPALLEILASGAPEQQAIACKQLAIHGTKTAVPALAKLLADPQLASWSRIALEAIPDPAADEALVAAAGSLDGRLLVGVINSLGVRRTAAATDQLAARLKAADAEVASAAAVALGRIANDKATAALLQSLASSPVAVRGAVAEGLILCAEHLAAEGKIDEAAAIYDEVRKADVPKSRVLDATRGAILARKSAGLPLLAEQLASPDKAFFYLGLTAARELDDPAVAAALDDALQSDSARTSPIRAVALLATIGDVAPPTLPPAVLAAAKAGDPQVRIAAIGAIGRSPEPSSVPTLLELAADADEQVSAAAIAALAALPGDGVNRRLVEGLPRARGKVLASLIEIIGQRRVPATDALTAAATGDDPAVRRAALVALGETIDQRDLPALIAHVLSIKSAEDAEIATGALRAACARMPDREACAAELAAVMPDAPSATKIKLIEILGAVGGPKALSTIAAAAQGGDAPLYDAATRVLGEWMTVDAAPALLALAQDPANKKFQVRALRGYLRLARQFTMPDDDRAAMCEQAIAAATRPDEGKLVLEVAARYPTARTLAVALRAKQQPPLKEDAARAAMIIAQRLIEQGADPGALLAKIGEKPVKLEILSASYGADSASRDVTSILQQQVRGLPLITLPGTSFNKSFGGDPAPGMPKALRVKYRLDGKEGEASFPENTVIFLPTPK